MRAISDKEQVTPGNAADGANFAPAEEGVDQGQQVAV